jgi:hypothetical protein
MEAAFCDETLHDALAKHEARLDRIGAALERRQAVADADPKETP